MPKLLKFISDNAGVLTLLALAFIVCMPDDPPAGLREVPRWLYRWVTHALKTFVSFRTPGPAPKDPPKPQPVQ